MMVKDAFDRWWEWAEKPSGSTHWPSARSTALITARWEAWARRPNCKPANQRQSARSQGCRSRLNLSQL